MRVPKLVILSAFIGNKRSVSSLLNYGVTAFADAEIDKLKSKLPLATDWEKIELEERIGGLLFAKECLDEAWMKRKDGTK